jgi:hypothetical protein
MATGKPIKRGSDVSERMGGKKKKRRDQKKTELD